jgi:formate C-acetyltransferase
MYKYTPEAATKMANKLFKEERAINHLEGWFIIKEEEQKADSKYSTLPPMLRAAEKFREAIKVLPLSISDNAIFAGTQRDAFARSYALINPSFRVETFAGYCDPTAVYNDIDPTEEFSAERINALRELDKESAYIKALSKVYASCEKHTGEVAYFIEQVTGHLIPDMRYALKHGIKAMLEDIGTKKDTASDEQKENYKAMEIALDCVLILAKRYKAIADEQLKSAEGERKEQLALLSSTLDKVPFNGAETLFEAIQSYILLWQTMCLEQAPNPFAFSVGNADRIFEPYRAADNLSRDEAAALFKHFLVFFNVGDRSWAISQNLIVSGRDVEGNDLTNPSTYALLDA